MRPHPFLLALLIANTSGCKPSGGDDLRVANTPPAADSAAQRPSSAWWVTATFEPRETSIAGIPVQGIDSSWAAALLLDYSVLPPEAAGDPSGLADSSVRFALTGDFNRDGVEDRALVGVYRTRSDSTGRFLLILTTRNGRPIVAQLDTLPGPPGFSGLFHHADTLAWVVCMECDSYWEFAWDGESYAVLPSSFDEE